MASQLPELAHGEVPLEAIQRLKSPVGAARREHSYYGAMNKILACFFRHRKWLIKPQAPLYEIAAMLEEEDGLEANGAHSRRTSYGQVRAMGSAPIFPDFLVCTHTSSPFEDIPYLVVEIKRPYESVRVGLTRLNNYLERVEDGVPGLLVAGHKVGVVYYANMSEGDIPEVQTWFDIGSEEFLAYLRDIALA